MTPNAKVTVPASVVELLLGSAVTTSIALGRRPSDASAAEVELAEALLASNYRRGGTRTVRLSEPALDVLLAACKDRQVDPREARVLRGRINQALR